MSLPSPPLVGRVGTHVVPPTSPSSGESVLRGARANEFMCSPSGCKRRGGAADRGCRSAAPPLHAPATDDQTFGLQGSEDGGAGFRAEAAVWVARGSVARVAVARVALSGPVGACRSCRGCRWCRGGGGFRGWCGRRGRGG